MFYIFNFNFLFISISLMSLTFDQWLQNCTATVNIQALLQFATTMLELLVAVVMQLLLIFLIQPRHADSGDSGAVSQSMRGVFSPAMSINQPRVKKLNMISLFFFIHLFHCYSRSGCNFKME